jgi:hypothetical protein
MPRIRPATFILWGIATLLLAPAMAQAAQSLGAEEIFWRQPERVARAASAMAPARATHADVFFVGFAGDDSQEIFAREVRVAAGTVAERLDPPGRSLLLLNNRAANASGSPIASIGTLELALEELAPRMDLAEDVLFLYLTSHGLPSSELYVANGELPLEQITPARLRKLLARFGFRRKIIVVSACFSGDFARELVDDSTVVLTASRADRPSFGCRDSRGMTYFGEALWQFAMPRADTLMQAFILALARVDQMERGAGLVPSEPQMLVGRLAQEWLDQMRLQPAARSAFVVAGGAAGRKLAGILERERPDGMPARAPETSSPGQSLTD